MSPYRKSEEPEKEPPVKKTRSTKAKVFRTMSKWWTSPIWVVVTGYAIFMLLIVSDMVGNAVEGVPRPSTGHYEIDIARMCGRGLINLILVAVIIVMVILGLLCIVLIGASLARFSLWIRKWFVRLDIRNRTPADWEETPDEEISHLLGTLDHCNEREMVLDVKIKRADEKAAERRAKVKDVLDDPDFF